MATCALGAVVAVGAAGACTTRSPRADAGPSTDMGSGLTDCGVDAGPPPDYGLTDCGASDMCGGIDGGVSDCGADAPFDAATD